MEGFRRYAIYYAPPPGQLADFGAGWLGWDPVEGAEVAHPELPGLPRPISELTATPRKYGFHGTIKPPFRLAEGTGIEALHGAMSDLAATLPAVTLDGLGLHRLGGFLALTPEGDTTALAALAGEVVRGLDSFRAPPGPDEIARRQAAGLSPRQEALLARWGYPYVMEEFRFHLTLTGSLPGPEAAAVESALAPLLALILPQPFSVDSLCLFGEAADGRFHNLHRYTLSG
ncbi:DUF1045 domain-containing protein [Acidimangrovimonas pyrenivorans]|uniref:DUF1045 domain-containing protein n=1 Tax=Acidimangrovimonas pyrenivorans TaxID=2030798 RepID=A0ABV7AI85_9RHOB